MEGTRVVSARTPLNTMLAIPIVVPVIVISAILITGIRPVDYPQRFLQLESDYRARRHSQFAAVCLYVGACRSSDSSDDVSHYSGAIVIIVPPRIKFRTGRIQSVAAPVYGDGFQVERELVGARLPHNQFRIRSARDSHVTVSGVNVASDMGRIDSAPIPLTHIDRVVRAYFNLSPGRNGIR
jgi:hypothetical protein